MVVAYGNIGNKLNVNNERDKMKNINKHFLKVQLIRVASIVSVFMIITYQFSAMNIFAVTNQLCDDDGEFRYTKKNLTTDTTRQENALNWVKSMFEAPKSPDLNGSKINLDQEYSYDYTSFMSGEVSLEGNYAPINTAALIVESSSAIDDSYRGVVSGSLNNIDPKSGYKIVAYLETDQLYDQTYFTGSPTVDPLTGDWSIDLSSVPSEFLGSWRFALVDEEDGAQIGDIWPGKSVYDNLKIQSYSLTNAEYLIDEQELSGDLKWTLNSMLGDKIIRLIDTNTNKVIAENFNPASIGRARSYQYKPEDPGYNTNQKYLTYTYDQATSLLTFLGDDDKEMADLALKGLLSFQINNGEYAGAFTSHNYQFFKEDVGSSIYLGGNAFADYALIRYYEKYGDQNGVVNALVSNLDFIEKLKIDSGYGEGLYVGGYGYNDNTREYEKLTWVSTEHNTDLWHVFERASRVLDSKYEDSADLKNDIMMNLWNEQNKRFNRGLNDEINALDLNSWASVFLNAIGEYDKAGVALANTDTFSVAEQGTDGYFGVDDGSIKTIWYEGTFGVAYSYMVSGNEAKARQIVEKAYDKQNSDGSWNYTLMHDPINYMLPNSSLASTNWYLLATNSPNILWSECKPSKSTASDNNPTVLTPNTGYSRNNSIVIDRVFL